MRNRRDPSAPPLSRQGVPYKPKVKSGAAQRESEGVVVPERPTTKNVGGGKGPCGGRVGGGGKREGMAGHKTRSNNPGNRTVDVKVRQLQRRLWAAAKRSPGRRFHALYDRIHRSDVLREAWRRVKRNGGAAWVDAQTLEAIERYGVGRFLSEIQAELPPESRMKWGRSGFRTGQDLLAGRVLTIDYWLGAQAGKRRTIGGLESFFCAISESAPVGGRDEGLEFDDVDEVGAAEVLVEAAVDEEVAELPSLTTEHQISLVVLAVSESLGQADGLEWDLLFRGSGDLLPLEGDEVLARGAVLSENVDVVATAAKPVADHDLALT
jgi:hypothetical protein